jgi:hypothetical protein
MKLSTFAGNLPKLEEDTETTTNGVSLGSLSY